VLETAAHTLDRLRVIVGDAGLLVGRDELRVYECDGFPIAKGLPNAVVFPTSTQQVADCVRVIADGGLQIVPRGSGTGLTGGAVAFGGGVLVSTSRMKTIESIDPANRVAVCQAGVLNATLSAAVAATPGGQRLHFSPDPSSQKASTVGGNAATNAGGINTLKHGVTRNHILGLERVAFARIPEEILLRQAPTVQRLGQIHTGAAFADEARRDRLGEDDVRGTTRREDEPSPAAMSHLLEHVSDDHCRPSRQAALPTPSWSWMKSMLTLARA